MSYFENEVIGGEIVSAARPNIFLGILGAIGGALLGAAIWVGLYQLGVLASLAGIAIVHLSCKGYALLSKSKTLGGALIATLVAVLVLLAAHFLCWGLEIFRAFGSEAGISLWDAILAVPSIAFTKDFVLDFSKELLIGLILIGVGAAPFIRQWTRNSRKTSD